MAIKMQVSQITQCSLHITYLIAKLLVKSLPPKSFRLIYTLVPIFFTERIKSFSRSGGAAEQEANVRCAVSDLTQDGFTVVSIGIDFEYDPSAMYENHVNMTDLPGLAPDLGRLLLQRSAGTTLRCSLRRSLFTGPPRPAPQVNFVRKY